MKQVTDKLPDRAVVRLLTTDNSVCHSVHNRDQENIPEVPRPANRTSN